MIIRDGRRRESENVPSEASIPGYGGGSLVRPASAIRPVVVRVRTFDHAAWRRNKRATDPAWAERERARERALAARKRAAA